MRHVTYVCLIFSIWISDEKKPRTDGTNEKELARKTERAGTSIKGKVFF